MSQSDTEYFQQRAATERALARSSDKASVAERIGRMAPCPVLIVRHPEREFVLPDALQRTVQA